MADAEQAVPTIEPLTTEPPTVELLAVQAQAGPGLAGPEQAGPPAVETLILRTTQDDIKKSGNWVVPPQITAESSSGAITIDFTRAACAHREVGVHATTKVGEVQLILPKGWAARVDPGSSALSHITNKAPEDAAPGAPTVIVQGHPYLGQIVIRQHRRR
jgi:hypothetical protein